MENISTEQLTFLQDDLSLITNDENKEEVNDELFIWLNESHTNKTNYILETFGDLTGIIHNCKLFNDSDQCIDYITSIHSNKNIFLILSSHQFILPLIHELSQIKFLYVFNINQIDDDENKYVQYIEKEKIFYDKESLLNK